MSGSPAGLDEFARAVIERTDQRGEHAREDRAMSQAGRSSG
ncbi:MAG TPA: hypothetical protein VGG05_22375 [Pseudonocardiaceae bacterium]